MEGCWTALSYRANISTTTGINVHTVPGSQRAPFLASPLRGTKLRRNSLFAVGSVREPGPHSSHPQCSLQRSAHREATHDLCKSRFAPHSKSLRPQHTVEPLAELIGREKLRLDFSEGEEQQLVAAAVAVDGVVLVS